MKDTRLQAFRTALESLVESLAAAARITRWKEADAIPAPLEASASKLLERLGAANRFAAYNYVGPPAVVAALNAMSEATKKLDAAYVEYLRRLSGNGRERDESALALDQELERVTAESHRWG